MALEHSYVCPLPNGIHARPASVLEEAARGFASQVIVRNERTGREANVKSVLSVVGADIRSDDRCLFTVSGPDETIAMNALVLFLDERFPKCDTVAPTIPGGEQALPPLLRTSGASIRRGVPVSPGIGRGKLVRAGGFALPQGVPLDAAADPQQEQRQLDEALEYLVETYTQQLAAGAHGVEHQLLVAHRAMARDTELRRVLLESIHERRRTAAGAIADAEQHFSAMLSASGNALLRERSLDIQDICLQLLQRIYGVAGEVKLTLTEDSIIVAESLTPSQFLALDRRLVKSLVLQQAGCTSHTIILARSFGIPALTGVANLPPASKDAEGIVDADLGALVTDLTGSANRYYELEFERLSRRRAVLGDFCSHLAATADGRRLEVGANIGTGDEAAPAFDAGAESIGLFRTEMLFLERETEPSEEEQYQAYRRVLETAKDRSVIIRTLDVGGDKPVPWMRFAPEANPFLGWRAVRIYPAYEALFRTQVRALVRASAHGRLKLMVPMIATVEEARWVKSIIVDEQARCAKESVAFDPAMPIGGMIEVPSAAFAIEHLCRELDFFSIGSNDLLQYFTAADRSNSRVALIYNPLLPAFFRLLKQIVDGVRAQGKWVGLCGEIGGQSQLTPLLVGLGLDEISAAAPCLSALKTQVARVDSQKCRALLEAVCGCATVSEASQLLDQFDCRRHLSLLARDLIATGVDAGSKEEAIKRAIDLLYIHGRVDLPREVEQAVWDREAAYSTGFGYGFAIPHCKSNAVKCNSLVVLKLRKPVSWASLDDNPVETVILLAMRADAAASEHMKVFAKLARQVMHEEFRAVIRNESEPERLCAFLTEKLGAK